MPCGQGGSGATPDGEGLVRRTKFIAPQKFLYFTIRLLLPIFQRIHTSILRLWRGPSPMACMLGIEPAFGERCWHFRGCDAKYIIICGAI